MLSEEEENEEEDVDEPSRLPRSDPLEVRSSRLLEMLVEISFNGDALMELVVIEE